MLQVKELHKYYKSSKNETFHALKGIHIDFPNTGFVCIVGKSGSGKSTLLNILGGLERYDTGEILIKGKSSAKFSAKEWDSYRNTYLGFIFQDFNIIDSYSIGANIALALELQGVKKSEAVARTKDILKSVEADNLYDRKPNELSGGQKQRIAIARALVKNPEIIIADEPTGNLDSETSVVIMRILKNLSQNRLVIMVTHDTEYAEDYGDRIIELRDGNIIKDEGVKAPTTSPSKTRQKVQDQQALIALEPGQPLSQEVVNTLNQLIQNHPKKTIYLTAGVSSALVQHADPSFVSESPAKATSSADSVDATPAGNFKLIRSRLPFRNSFKMAMSSILSKKFKLIFASLLFVVSIGLFGFSRTVTRFDFPQAVTLSYEEAGIDRVILAKQIEQLQSWGETTLVPAPFEGTDITTLRETHEQIGLIYNFPSPVSLTGNNANRTVAPKSLEGVIEVRSLNQLNLTLHAGRFAQNPREVVLTDFSAMAFTEASWSDFLATSPTVTIGSERYDIVGILETDYQDYLYLNALSAAQLNAETQAVQSFQNKNLYLYSRLIVGEGFYATLTQDVQDIIDTYYFFAYLEARENTDQSPTEILSNGIFKATPDLLAHASSVLFSNSEAFPDNGILLDTFTYSRLLEMLGLVNSSDSLLYLNDGSTPLRERVARLESNGLGQVTFTSTLGESNFSQFTEYEDTVVVGLIDASEYLSERIFPPLYQILLEDQDLAFIDEATYLMYSGEGFSEYLETLRQEYVPSFATFDASSGSQEDYQQDLISALFQTGESFIDNRFSYGYMRYLHAELDENDVVYASFADSLSSEIRSAFDYFEALIALGETNDVSLLDFEAFTQTYMPYNLQYASYLDRLLRDNDLNSSLEYQSMFGFVVLSAERFDRVNPFTPDRVTHVMVQLSETTEQNYLFFTEAAALGVVHQTPIGSVLQIFGDFTQQADTIFGYVSLGFAGFAALLLFLNISQSILAKKKEIGTLRALGARGRDVASIFLNEASIIGLISVVLAIVAVGIATVQLNVFLSEQLGNTLSLFNISPIITLEMVLLTSIIVLLAAFLPVKRVSSMKPIDAIKNK